MQIPTKQCLVCDKMFEKPIWISLKNWNETRKYCSTRCQSSFWKGKPGRKLGKTGQKAWNKGLPGLKGKYNPSWKGDKIGYSGIHKWVVLHLGKPDTCEHCGKSGLIKQQIHWANRDHEYKRILKDWMRLCAKCHQSYDKLNNNY